MNTFEIDETIAQRLDTPMLNWSVYLGDALQLPGRITINVQEDLTIITVAANKRTQEVRIRGRNPAQIAHRISTLWLKCYEQED